MLLAGVGSNTGAMLTDAVFVTLSGCVGEVMASTFALIRSVRVWPFAREPKFQAPVVGL